MVSSTLGSSTRIFWKRRSSAASFSMYWRYSSSVVAPTQCNSPRASAGLSMLPGVHCAFGFAGADHRVQLVDEEDDVAFLLREFVQHRLQTFFEFAAEFRARDQRTHVERENAFALQPFRHLAIRGCAVRAPRRSRSCRRPVRRSAPDCSSCAAAAPGSCGEFRRRDRSPGRACLLLPAW